MPDNDEVGLPAPLTLVYKRVQGVEVQLDVYAPRISSEEPLTTHGKPTKHPALVYFHGGGLTVGNRKSWFPHWLHTRMASSGVVFIAADYRLVPPGSGEDIVEDIRDLFSFISRDLNDRILEQSTSNVTRNADPEPRAFEVDHNSTAVAGTSSGGLCAYLAALHAIPRPVAVLSMYGMGGNMLTSQYFEPKTSPFFRGRDILDPSEYAEYLYPASKDLPVTSDSPLAYHPLAHPTPGYPANPRMVLARLYLQIGTFLDYYTGIHDPSLSLALRGISKASTHSTDVEAVQEAIPHERRHLFPQLCVSPNWPPTFLVHGASDSAVLLRESENLRRLLQEAGVTVTLRNLEGKEHSFDYAPEAEEEYAGLFDEACDFLVQHLRR